MCLGVGFFGEMATRNWSMCGQRIVLSENDPLHSDLHSADRNLVFCSYLISKVRKEPQRVLSQVNAGWDFKESKNLRPLIQNSQHCQQTCVISTYTHHFQHLVDNCYNGSLRGPNRKYKSRKSMNDLVRLTPSLSSSHVAATWLWTVKIWGSWRLAKCK